MRDASYPLDHTGPLDSDNPSISDASDALLGAAFSFSGRALRTNDEIVLLPMYFIAMTNSMKYLFHSFSISDINEVYILCTVDTTSLYVGLEICWWHVCVSM